jgi:Dolichyl-phosphate-mannose-protein mannosyltransferase
VSEQLPSQERTGRVLLMLLAFALVLRCGVVLVLPGNLTDDRDIYLALARGLRESRGFSVPGTEQPTAFRPPLFPIVLAAATAISEPVGVALLNIVLGVATVAVTYTLGLRLGLSRRGALIAGGIVAADPLLLLYTTFPMTETLCAFLAVAMLLAVCPAHGSPEFEARNPKQIRNSKSECSKRPARPRLRSAVVAGLLYGLCVLSRPTFWAFGGLMAIRYFAGVRSRSSAEGRMWWTSGAATVAAVILVVAAWPIRNLAVLGSPIMTTTHGGYTLLLGNNRAFYDEAVRQPLGTVWDGSHGPGQQVWVAGINDEMDRLGVNGEVARDRWMSRRAWHNIGEQPGTFFRACVLRFVRFWNIVPSGPAAEGVPTVTQWAVGCFYCVVFAAGLIGLVVVLRRDARRWMPVILMVVSFTVVHLVYWSNVRMRAPIVPAVALLAAVVSVRRERVRVVVESLGGDR